MAKRPGIFPTFFLSGFECSTFLWKDRKRRDLVVETQYRWHAREGALHEPVKSEILITTAVDTPPLP